MTENWTPVHFYGQLELAVPTITADEWCHPECYQRWIRLSRDSQGFIGGHIHYDKSNESWSVPFQVPLETIGVKSSAGVCRPSF